MGIRRRSLLQAGVGMLLASATHSCVQPSQSTSGLEVSRELLAQINQRGYLLVATEDDYPPFEFLVNGKPVGFDNELLDTFRKLVPFEIRQEILPWQGLLPGVASGKYDVALTAVGFTDERSRSLDFTMPISESTIAYVKRKGDQSIQHVRDLSRKTLGTQQGGLSFAAVPDLQARLTQTGGSLGAVKQYRNFTEAYQDLLNQRLDAVLNNIVSLSVLVNDKPSIFELGERVSRKSYAGWAVKKGNQALLDLLNRFLTQQHNNGELKRLQQKWFKLTFNDLPTQPLLPGDRPIQ
ncbi:MAG: transporter substrate-binding domain-containing protein [Oscillatoriales cyanobacterium C42_A2020_001]|nr:transporter substrate-binding domain-containing protein [Leptolyngbyaceae cyanobacterium C42_A2020_001]